MEPENETDYNSSENASKSESTTSTTTTLTPKTCNAGWEPLSEECRSCDVGFFKDRDGSGRCVACPPESTTRWHGSTSEDDCRCNITSYKAPIVNATSFVCAPCPPNSFPPSWGATSREDCSCKSKEDTTEFIAVKTNGLLERCRAPLPCDVHARLEMLNLTGPSTQQLQNGTCGNITWLENGASCSLACVDATAAQARSNIIEAIDVSVLCEDGEITRHPAVGTWCSRDAYLLPPLVLLGTVAFASVLGGIFVERRQNRWAKECTEALRFRGSGSSPKHKSSD